MRGFSRRLVLAFLLFLAVASAATSLLAAPRSAPTRSRSGSFVSIHGIEYISTTEFASRYDLKAVWTTRGKRVAIIGGKTRVELEADARDCQVNSLRVLMGEPARLYRKTLYISKIDAERFIGPIIDPSLQHSPRAAVRVVALDAGHGGRDKGKVNDRLGVMEKTVTLDVVQRLKKILEASGFKVVLTRSDDRYVELDDRPALAKKAGADVFVSVHFNSVETGAKRVTGVEVFSLTPQYQFSTDDSQREATDQARIFNPGNANDALNSRLGYEIHRQIVHDLKVADRGHKRQRFKVLRLAECPAVLIEGGYLSNDTEARKIATASFRQNLARSIADGVINFAELVKAK
ncbi:MAG TPA: N-acetylmuramoyl-L-alanine amidase [Opitutaceae bacterium]|nr:N-acetylmuramoyl-L-alanine amidase [Opitutaceae bacterium]